MNPEIKTKWLEALRSGQYKQGWRQLKDFGDSYCCLGVLCDVQGINLEQGANKGRDTRCYGSLAFPLVEDLAGLSLVKAKELACMNDQGKSFNEIADYIEENL